MNKIPAVVAGSQSIKHTEKNELNKIRNVFCSEKAERTHSREESTGKKV